MHSQADANSLGILSGVRSREAEAPLRKANNNSCLGFLGAALEVLDSRARPMAAAEEQKKRKPRNIFLAALDGCSDTINGHQGTLATLPL